MLCAHGELESAAPLVATLSFEGAVLPVALVLDVRRKLNLALPSKVCGEELFIPTELSVEDRQGLTFDGDVDHGQKVSPFDLEELEHAAAERLDLVKGRIEGHVPRKRFGYGARPPDAEKWTCQH